ncbi:hypothetical protein QQZ08_000535 [Neonectria magnoliae]|uniref:Uncharacterized protein n=1 Tax=Neonectria magnoliae TaxID=2732573 RepID=A0ABR1IHC6_9HYPO
MIAPYTYREQMHNKRLWHSLSMKPAYYQLDKAQMVDTKRHSFKATFELDDVLGTLSSSADRPPIDQVVGMLALTNVEFLVLVYQSVRNPKHTIDSARTIWLDIRSTTPKVP